MSNCFIVGSTGLCGSFILEHAAKYYDKVYSLSRRQPKSAKTDVKHEIILNDNKDNGWVNMVNGLNINEPDTFFSGLGTTRSAAGGLENQYKIDHDLNLELAKAAKLKGFKQYVLISSGGANKNSYFPYLKMKGELEDDVIALGFERTIILRPGVLLGERDQDKGVANNILAFLGKYGHNNFMSRFLGHPSYGEEVGKAALKVSKTEIKEKVLIVTGTEINNIAKN